MFAKSDDTTRAGAVLPLGNVALAWLELDGRARLILDSELRVIWRNAAAVNLLRQYRGIEIDRDHVTHGELHDQLNKFLKDRAVARWEKPIRLGTGEGHYIVLAIRISAPEDLVCIEIRVAHPDAPISYVDLREPFGLTATEARIALLLLDGMSVTEIAKSRNTSIETIRSHVRAIYEKMHASTREELFSSLRYFQSI